MVNRYLLIIFTCRWLDSVLRFPQVTRARALGNFCRPVRPQISSFFIDTAKVQKFQKTTKFFRQKSTQKSTHLIFDPRILSSCHFVICQNRNQTPQFYPQYNKNIFLLYCEEWQSIQKWKWQMTIDNHDNVIFSHNEVAWLFCCQCPISCQITWFLCLKCKKGIKPTLFLHQIKDICVPLQGNM